MSGTDIKTHPIHLGQGAIAETEPLFSGSMEWYINYAERHRADGTEGRLVSMHSFSKSWDVWEMHPYGSEVVMCIAGTVTLHQEKVEGSVTTTTLKPSEYAINQSGVWHTADVEEEATVLFITAGMGTQHRPRLFNDAHQNFGV